MTKEKLQEKIIKSCRDCTTCEFAVVPITVKPCSECDKETDNWTEKRK